MMRVSVFLALLFVAVACSVSSPVKTPVSEEDDVGISESAYLAEMISASDDAMLILVSVGDLVTDDSRAWDDSFFEDLAYNQSELSKMQVKVSLLEPPSVYSDSHSYFTQALAKLAASLDLIELFTHGLGVHDPGNIEDLNLAVAYAKGASAMLIKSIEAMP